MHSYIYEDEDFEEEEDEDLKEEEGDKIIDVITENNNRNSDPLLSNNDRKSRNSFSSNRDSKPKFTGENIEDKQMLYSMGFKYQLINTIYNNMHPIDIQEALDYLNKNDKGKFTHSYIENDRFVCTICSQGRYAHENTALFVDNLLNNQNNINIGTNTGTNTGTNSITLNVIPTNSNNNLNSNLGNSNRFNRIESSYLNSKNKYSYYNYDKPKECGICGDTIESQDAYKVKLSCNHYFCLDCWENYLKEKINNLNVAKISCMQHGCSVVLTELFIKKILNTNDELVKKYEKFLKKQKLLMSNKNIKFCPFPDCDGYAEKKDKNNKYVKCNFDHEFCFECLNKPHGTQKCEELIDKEFEEWKKHKIVKRCPNCQMWTEKNEGCNHMTCVECKFQWCWLCQKKYEYGHYNYGSCKGLQFEKEQDEEKIKKMLEDNLKKYPSPPPNPYRYDLYPYVPPPRRRRKCQCLIDILKEILIFLVFLFLYPYFFFFRMADRTYYLDDCYFFTYIASVVPVFICFEIFFFSLNIIIAIPAFIFSNYYKDLYDFVRDAFD